MSFTARPRGLGVVLALAIVAVVFIAARRHQGADAPFSPHDDAEVLERLPAGLGADPAADETRALEALLARQPNDLDLATRVVRRHLDAARRTGDARLLSYAEAALAPWWSDERPPLPALLLRATIEQARHDFELALKDLRAASELSRGTLLDAQVRLSTSAVLRVLGQHEQASAECDHLRGIASELVQRTCTAVALAPTAMARAQRTRLSPLVGAPGADKLESTWAESVLGELSYYLGDTADAERALRAVLAADSTDTYARALLCDVLLDAGRPGEVLALVLADEPNDVLLLRRAIASKRAHAPDAAPLARELRTRADELRLRGDRTHQREEARLVLELEDDAARALPIAVENFTRQKEPWDARLLLEAAARRVDPAALAAAAPAVRWAEETHNAWPPLARALALVKPR